MDIRTAHGRELLAVRLLEELNRKQERAETIRSILFLLRDATGVEAAGLRVREGNDFPYYEVSGFELDFVTMERSVCSSSEKGERQCDSAGKPDYECLCGNVLQGAMGLYAPLLSDSGSFFTSDMAQLVETLETADFPLNLRLECFRRGYRTLALVPLKAEGELLGLLQLADKEVGKLTEEHVRYLQRVGNAIGVGLHKLRSDEKMEEMYRLLKSSHDNHLSTLNLLRLGVIVTDEADKVTFLNETACRFVQGNREAVIGRQLGQVMPVSDDDMGRLSGTLAHRKGDSGPVQFQLELAPGRRFWLEGEVHRDPLDLRRKVFLLYDLTELYDLRQLLGERGEFFDMVGHSAEMQDVFRRIRDIASVDLTALVEGDTGTGKELAARAIHSASRRADGPFVAVNCAGLSDPLLSSQLFGHIKGAFTGATQDRKGYFEAASGGTLFLDEIGDISPKLQATLLRVLEEKTVTRVGDTRPRPVDVRVVAATHHDLAKDVEQGLFRTDLLYRLRVARVILPPLTKRREDIPLLVGVLLRRISAAMGKQVKGMDKGAMKLLSTHSWPGNVRELRSCLEYASLHCAGKIIREEDLPPEITGPRYGSTPMPDDPKEREKARIRQALVETSGNRKAAAQLLGIGRATLYRKLSQFQIAD